jgi:hypothetical protein
VNVSFWVLRRIFGHKSVEITGCKLKLHNEELHSEADENKKYEMDRECNTHGRGAE